MGALVLFAGVLIPACKAVNLARFQTSRGQCHTSAIGEMVNVAPILSHVTSLCCSVCLCMLDFGQFLVSESMRCSMAAQSYKGTYEITFSFFCG